MPTFRHAGACFAVVLVVFVCSFMDELGDEQDLDYLGHTVLTRLHHSEKRDVSQTEVAQLGKPRRKLKAEMGNGTSGDAGMRDELEKLKAELAESKKERAVMKKQLVDVMQKLNGGLRASQAAGLTEKMVRLGRDLEGKRVGTNSIVANNGELHDKSFCFWLHGYSFNPSVMRLMESIRSFYPETKIVITSDKGSDFKAESKRYNATVFMAESRNNQGIERPPFNFSCQVFMRRLGQAAEECRKGGAEWIVAMEDDCVITKKATAPPPFDAVYAVINKWPSVEWLRKAPLSPPGSPKVVSLMKRYEQKFLEMGGWGMAGGTTYKIEPLQRGLAAFDWDVGQMAKYQDMCMPQFVIWAEMTFGLWSEIRDGGRNLDSRCAACMQTARHHCHCARSHAADSCTCAGADHSQCWRDKQCPHCPFIIHGGSAETDGYHCNQLEEGR